MWEKRYAIKLAIELARNLCLECSFWQIFLSSSLTVAMKEYLRSMILSFMDNNVFLCCCGYGDWWMSFTNGILALCRRCSLYRQIVFQKTAFRKPWFLSRPWSATSVRVMAKFNTSPLFVDQDMQFKAPEPALGGLTYRCPLNTLFLLMRLLLQTLLELVHLNGH